MKKITLSFILLLSIFIFWCNDINQKDQLSEKIEINEEVDKEVKQKIETIIYENKNENYSFKFPKDRNFEENQYWFNTIVFTPEDDDIKENIWISIQKLQKFLSIQEYYEETLNELNNTLVWFKELKSENIEINWIKGKKIAYQHNISEKELKSEQTFLISNENIVYSINYTATTETFDNFIEWVNIILQSFKVIN